ncbi:F0F1 ATP synthase subunit delta [Demequina litorisediminis]|uniref:F0F1 ATP synthase subunit delta n=1 Tax=Demequina litorisediminis TaxID=1849022 RepID=UPI0024E090E2|nr:F0F1 ATP synthase subunit delta [Demequina litorisediminis]
MLKDAYGRDIQINVAVDPEVLGGIRVQVGSEVVDGTIISKLDDARRRLVGYQDDNRSRGSDRRETWLS